MGSTGKVRLQAVVFLVACVAAIVSGCSSDKVAATSAVTVEPGYMTGNTAIAPGTGTTRDSCSGRTLNYSGQQDDRLFGVTRTDKEITFDFDSSSFEVRALIVGQKLDDYSAADADPQVTAQLSIGQIEQFSRTRLITLRTKDFQPLLEKISWVTFCN